MLGWPETARGMTAHIQQYELTYRAAGLTYVIGQRTKTSRKLVLTPTTELVELMKPDWEDIAAEAADRLRAESRGLRVRQ